MRDFADYRHYVFDLYGTLINIHTDETLPELWRWMADWYAVFGADWTPVAMRRRYRRLCAAEEALLRRQTGCATPEIQIDKVFLRLFREADRRHPAACAPRGDAAEAAWAAMTANGFRVCARVWLRPYPAARELLERLRARGKGVYLLSNAQAVFTRPEIEQCGLADAFDDVFLSSDHGIRKPEPAFLAELMAAHGMAAAETVMIGNDWRDDMGVAAANGVAGIVVNSDRLSAARRRECRAELAARFSPDAAARIADVPSLAHLLRRL